MNNNFGTMLIGVLMLFIQCSPPSGVQMDLENVPYQTLSQYQFFQGQMKDLKPNEGVLPYDVITPLFSDYAEKARFVWMPRGTAAKVAHADETFDFPTGAVLIKNFYYFEDERSPDKGVQLIETRLLVRGENDWEAHDYIWNEEMTEAYLDITGDVKYFDWVDKLGKSRKVSFVIPNKNQCKGCHEYKKRLEPIGLKLRHLNKMFNYSDGAQNQLEKWHQVGYLKDSFQNTEEVVSVAAWDDPQALLKDRALAYMEINCGICHSEHGPANVSGLFLTTLQKDLSHFGICKSPVSAGSGSGGRKYDIVPGQPEASILVYRMESLNPGEMMPELGRTVNHLEGIELIKQWILSLEGSCPESL